MGKAELIADRSANEARQSEVRFAIEVAEEKIVRLKNTYEACHNAKDVAKKKYDNINDVENECRTQFAGFNADVIYEEAAIGNLGSAYRTYVDSMDELMEKINDEIYKQKK